MIEPREHHIRVTRTARYTVLGEPASARELWFVLHGYRQLAARFIRRFHHLPGAGRQRAVIAPEALSRFYVERETGPHGPGSRVGASWMTRADRDSEIRDYVHYLGRVASAVAGSDHLRSATILGFSQGAETASRWAVLGDLHPRELVLWGGGLAVDLEPDELRTALHDVRLTFVTGSDDPWGQRRADESQNTLRDLDLPTRRLSYTGGHTIHADTLRQHWPA